MDLRLCHHPCSPGDSVMDCEHNQYRRSEAPGTCRCHHLFCAPATLRGGSGYLLFLLKLSGKARPRQASMARRFPYLLLRWLAAFECVNERDEKGDSENVARVGSDGDVHFSLAKRWNAVAATLGTCPFPRALSLSTP